MANEIIPEYGNGGWLMTRSSAIGGATLDIDATVRRVLADFNTALTKPLLEDASDEKVKALLEKKLAPRRSAGGFPAASLGLAVFKPDKDAKLSLGDYIHQTTSLSLLRYGFTYAIENQRATISANVLAILDGHEGIVDYLVASAYLHLQGRGKREEDQPIEGLVNFVLNHPLGVKVVLDYATVTAARQVITRDHLKVPDLDDDSGDFITALRKATPALSASAFEKTVKSVVEEFISTQDQSDVLEAVKGLFEIKESIKPQLLQYIKEWPIPVTKENAAYVIPIMMAQIEPPDAPSEVAATSSDIADQDFDVDYYEDDAAQLQVSRSAVKCAAQLYYGMVVGDELDVFNVVNYFTHRYLVRGQVEIQDRRLRDDLQMYVFSGKFTDLDTKRVVDRTRTGDRQMFYRQVFNAGSGPVTDDVILNREFSRMWKVLMLESARYLERAQLSPNPHSFVSKQNVMQAVEDLQYNLSTHCTGMATVMSPLIDAELDFVIRRIFMHEEVLKHVVPAGGTWWRVIETLYLGMKNMRPKATVLYNKARLGHKIIRAIADYDPPRFETNKNFSQFITDVDAFITTQSILQDALTDDLRQGSDATDDETGEVDGGDEMTGAPEPAMAGAGGGQDEWDF